jgi:hypothetical protein
MVLELLEAETAFVGWEYKCLPLGAKDFRIPDDSCGKASQSSNPIWVDPFVTFFVERLLQSNFARKASHN